MGGLLYKDFICIKGKRIAMILTLITVVLCLLRVVFPGSAATVDNGFLANNDDGKLVNFIDMLFAATLAGYVFAIIVSVSSLSVKITDSDKQSRNIENYLRSMPVDNNSYVSSKYIFIGVTSYALLSIACIIGIVFAAFCELGLPKDLINMTELMCIPLTSLILLIASIELPLFILLGKEKGNFIKTAILLIVVLIILGFILFGDLSLFTGEDTLLLRIMRWYMDHQLEATAVSYVSPVIAIIIYYLSYRITSFFRDRRDIGGAL